MTTSRLKHGLAHQVCESTSQKMKPAGDPQKSDLREVFSRNLFRVRFWVKQRRCGSDRVFLGKCVADECKVIIMRRFHCSWLLGDHYETFSLLMVIMRVWVGLRVLCRRVGLCADVVSVLRIAGVGRGQVLKITPVQELIFS